MNKYVLGLTTLSTVMILTGCGVNTKTPEDTYKSAMNEKATYDAEGYTKLISQESLHKQNLDEKSVEESIQKNINDLKASKFSIDNINITKNEKIDDKTVIVHADVRYKTSDKSEVQILHDNMVVLKKEGDGWKISYGNFIASYNTNNSCSNDKQPIEICINKILYYLNEIDLYGSVNNKTNNTYAFGFASQSTVSLKMTDKGGITGSYGEMGNRINSGKTALEVPITEIGTYYMLHGLPSQVTINNIIKMNGSLPAGFDNGDTVQVNIKKEVK